MLIRKKIKKTKFTVILPESIVKKIADLKKKAGELDAELPVDEEIALFLEKLISRAEKEMEKLQNEFSSPAEQKKENRFSFSPENLNENDEEAVA